MANKEELLEKAQNLGLDVNEESTKADIQAALDNYDAEQEPEDGESRYFKTPISGLTIPFGEAKPGEMEKSARFTPYQLFDQAKGDHYKVGLLATDEPDILEVLEKDGNVQEIDQEEYEGLIESGKKVGV